MDKKTVEWLLKEAQANKSLNKPEKSSLPLNNFLFLPTEDYREMSIAVNQLTDELFEKAKEFLAPIINSIQPHIKDLALTISKAKTNKNKPHIKEAMEWGLNNFYTNKLLDDFFSAINFKDFRSWLFKWKLNEFTMPFFLSNALEKSNELLNSYENYKKRLGGLDISDPNEQKLFEEVWKINDTSNKKYIKFSPYATFKKINDKKNYVDSELIYFDKFTKTSELYNRYKQFRKRQQKK